MAKLLEDVSIASNVELSSNDVHGITLAKTLQLFAQYKLIELGNCLKR
jgi:hypothetical protein